MKEHLLFRWLPVLLWAIFIYTTSANQNPYRPLHANWSIPTVLLTNLDSGSKLISDNELLGRFSHAAEYLVLAALTARALVWRGDPYRVLLAIAFGISGLYAISDEIHQILVPGRAFEWSDLVLDLGGSVIGVLVYASILTFWKRWFGPHR